MHAILGGGEWLVSVLVCILYDGQQHTGFYIHISNLWYEALLQLFKEVSEEVSVGVLAELVEDKPVTQVAVWKNTPASRKVGVGKAPGAEE